MAAEAGCEAVGIDIASTAIRLAEAKAAERGASARFVVGDARSLEVLGEQFDAVLDCGLFHVFDDEDRAPFVASLARAVRVGGHYFMLCFSEEEPGGWGPRRVTQGEIREAFDARVACRGDRTDGDPRDGPSGARPLVVRHPREDLRTIRISQPRSRTRGVLDHRLAV